jgi:hypothetical protein
MIVSKPLHGNSFPTLTMRGASPRGARRPLGVNLSTSTPEGITEMPGRGLPIRISWNASSVQLADTPVAVFASFDSRRSRGPVPNP